LLPIPGRQPPLEVAGGGSRVTLEVVVLARTATPSKICQPPRLFFSFSFFFLFQKIIF